MALLTKGDETVFVIDNLTYHLERMEEYSFPFYGARHKFILALADDLPLSEQPFSLLGTAADFSGRMLILLKEFKRMIWFQKHY